MILALVFVGYVVALGLARREFRPAVLVDLALWCGLVVLWALTGAL